MIGPVILAKLASESAVVTALVEPSQVLADNIPIDSPLPAIGFTKVSGVDRNLMSPRALSRRTERVQATVVATSKAEARAVLNALRSVLRNRMGDFAGVQSVVIHTDGDGAEFTDMDPALHMQTQDFRVSYNEAI